MNHQLIMLPNPILVSDEKDVKGYFPKVLTRDYEIEDSVDGENLDWLLKHGGRVIIAGLPELPQLDLSLVADEIGYVDVEKLAWISCENRFSTALAAGWWVEGFKACQSLNQKKYTEEEVREVLFEAGQTGVFTKESCLRLVDRLILKLNQPKVYNVEVEMCCYKYARCNSNCRFNGTEKPRIVNNTIKVTKIL